MNSLKKSKKILLDSIEEWKKLNSKLIIAIDGYSGAGKTTLIKDIAKEDADILVVNRDDFAIPRKEFSIKFRDAKTEQEKAALLVNEMINAEELKSFLKEYKKIDSIVDWTLYDGISGIKDNLKSFDFSKKVLLLEGIFIFHHKDLNDLFDRKVFFEIDQVLADERRRKREKERWGKDYWPDTHPDSYFRLAKIGFSKYQEEENPAGQADLVIELN